MVREIAGGARRFRARRGVERIVVTRRRRARLLRRRRHTLALRAGPRRRPRRATRVLARGIRPQRAHQALSQTLCRADRRHRDGRRRRPLDAWLASRRHRARRLRHARGRHRLLPRRRRDLGAAARAASHRRRRWPPRACAPTARDMAALGLATAYVDSADLPALAEALERPGDTARASSANSRSRAAVAADGAGGDDRARFRGARARAASSTRRCAADGSDFARELLDMLTTKSPTTPGDCAAANADRRDSVIRGRHALEFRIVSRICRGHDFYEGVRAAIVDKDNRAAMAPAAGERHSGGRHRRLFRAARRARNSSSRRARLRYQDAPKPRRRHSHRRSAAAHRSTAGSWRCSRCRAGADDARLVHAHDGLRLGRQGPVQLGGADGR